MKLLIALLVASPLAAQGIRYNAIASQDRQAPSGTQFQMTKSTAVHTGCVQYDSDGNIFGTALACGSGAGTITNVATSSPISGGPITTTGTISCPTCVTSAAALTTNAVLIGGGGQATSTISADTTTTHALFATAGAPAFRALTSGDLPAGTGTVTSVATTSPITGGTITGTGTIACATCVTSAASLTTNLPVFGSGGAQGTVSGTRSGNTTEVATVTGSLTSGNCVKSDASGNIVDSGLVCSAATGGPGFVLLEEHTGTAGVTTELDFTTCISSTYDDYMIRLTQVVPGTSTANLQMQMSTNGGSSYDTGNNYDNAYFAFVSAGTGTGGGTAQGFITIGPSLATTANMSVAGTVNLAAPGGSIYKQLYWQTFARDTNNAHAEGFIGAATYLSTTAVNAFRVIVSTGTFSGTVRCYGISK